MKISLSLVKKHFPVAYQIMKSKNIRKATLDINGKLYIDEDTTYTLVAPSGETKVVKIGGEWGGIQNTNYINNQYPIPENYYAVTTQLFLGKWLVEITTPKTPELS